MSGRDLRQMKQLHGGDRCRTRVLNREQLGVAMVFVSAGDFELNPIDRDWPSEGELYASRLALRTIFVFDGDGVAQTSGHATPDHMYGTAIDGEWGLPFVLDHDAVVAKLRSWASDSGLRQSECSPRPIDEIPVVDE